MKRNGKGFLGTITPGKIINLFTLRISLFLSVLLKRVILLGDPAFISVEPSNRCNLKCTGCPSGNKSPDAPSGNMDMNIFRSIISELSANLIAALFYFRGEPFMHPRLTDMIGYAGKKRIYTITSTNGHFLNRENCLKIIQSRLNNLIVSLDGTDSETYTTYRKGGNIQLVIDGIRNMAEAKHESGTVLPFVTLQFIVFRHNQHQVREIRKLGKEWGADQVVIKTAHVQDMERNSALIPDKDSYSRYTTNRSGEVVSKQKMHNRCLRIWQSLVILYDGSIVPCCFDKDIKHPAGNLSDGSTVGEVWRGESFYRFRKAILKKRGMIVMCRNCTEGLRNVFV